MLTIDLPEHVQDALRDAPLIRQEQYLDFLRNVGFRSTLLCHREIELDRDLPDERMSGFWVQLSARPRYGEVDLTGDDPLEFDIQGNKLTVSLPLTKAAMVHLGRTWPEAIAVGELHDRALKMLGRPAATDDRRYSIDALNYMLKMALAANVLEIYIHPPQCVSTIGDRPLTSPLARYQAPRQDLITNRWHGVVKLDALGRFILARLDGQHDRAALQAALLDSLQRGLFAVRQKNKPLDVSTAQTAEMVDWALKTCASAKLLLAQAPPPSTVSPG
jgi:methyltransferase-like protein